MSFFEKEFVFSRLPTAEKDRLEKQFKLLKELFPNGIFTIYDLVLNKA